MGLGNWIKSFFDRIGALISRMWGLAKPFLQEALSATGQLAWASCKDLFIEAAGYVAGQGLPTTEAKQKAFREYMESKSVDELKELKDSEFNLLREMAVAIQKKISQG